MQSNISMKYASYFEKLFIISRFYFQVKLKKKINVFTPVPHFVFSKISEFRITSGNMANRIAD